MEEQKTFPAKIYAEKDPVIGWYFYRVPDEYLKEVVIVLDRDEKDFVLQYGKGFAEYSHRREHRFINALLLESVGGNINSFIDNLSQDTMNKVSEEDKEKIIHVHMNDTICFWKPSFHEFLNSGNGLVSLIKHTANPGKFPIDIQRSSKLFKVIKRMKCCFDTLVDEEWDCVVVEIDGRHYAGYQVSEGRFAGMYDFHRYDMNINEVTIYHPVEIYLDQLDENTFTNFIKISWDRRYVH